MAAKRKDNLSTIVEESHLVNSILQRPSVTEFLVLDDDEQSFINNPDSKRGKMASYKIKGQTNPGSKQGSFVHPDDSEEGKTEKKEELKRLTESPSKKKPQVFRRSEEDVDAALVEVKEEDKLYSKPVKDPLLEEKFPQEGYQITPIHHYGKEFREEYD